MATTKNLVIDQGAGFSANIQYLDYYKRPISLVGFDVRSKLRTSYDAANAASFTTVVTNAATGNVNISFTANETSRLKYGRYVYDIEAYQGNTTLRIVEGAVTVTPRVSGADLGSLLRRDVTTSDLPEGTNLYYTNARVYSVFSEYAGNIIPAEANTYNLGSPEKRWKSLFLEDKTIYLGNVAISLDDLTNKLTFIDTSNANATINLQIGTGANAVVLGTQEGTLSTVLAANSVTTNVIADGAITPDKISGFNTANVPEFTNLYYTNARARSAFTAGANIFISAGGVISALGGGGNVTITGLATESNLALKANVIDLTTNNVTELTNLYYTNTRVYSNVIGLLNAKANVSDLNTNNVTEGNNLYYTNARARSAFTAGSNITISAGGVISSSGGGGGGGGTVVTADLTTANVTEVTNLYFTNARVYSNVVSILNSYATTSNLNLKANLTQLTTANVSEVTNLYYTNARTRSALSSGTGVSYDTTSGAISIGQNVSTTAAVTFANLTVTGVTNFYGNVITHSSNNLSISDNMIYLNAGSESSNPDLGIAGNYNDGVYHHTGFFRDATDGIWKVFDNYTPEPDANIFIDTSHATFRLANIQATAFTGNLTGNVTGFVSSISNFTTSNLSEGNNLYYTNARVYSNVIALLNAKANVTDLTTANVTETASGLYYTNARVYSNVITLLNAKANVGDLTTSNVTEGNNLYYTNARVYSNVILLLNAKANVGDLSTSNVVEGNNLYYTNARVYANVVNLLTNYATSANLNLKANATQLTTGNVLELGANLYYSNARVYSNITALLPEYTGNLKSGNLTVGTSTGGAILGANLITANTITVTTITANTVIVTSNPAFRVYGLGSLVGSGVTLSGGGTTTAVDYNQGSAYSSSTGVFTAPVAGFYHIYLNASFRTNTVHAATQVAVLKNNLATSGNILCVWEMIENYDTTTFGVSTVAYLAANDNIRAKVMMGQIMFDSNCSYGAIKIG